MTSLNFFKEQKHYKYSDLKEKFENEKNLTELLKLDVVKLEGSDIKFKYVGVIIIEDNVICCYPKYFPEKNAIDDDFKQILNVIKKYNVQKNYSFYKFDDFSDSTFNLLSLMLFFIEDYYENGIYTKTQNILEINGNGEIDWNRTVNESFSIIKNEKPYYIEFKTRRSKNNLYDYFRLLHKCIITECSKFLENSGLLELFNLNSVDLSENSSKEDFGDEFFIKEKLLKELNVEFNTHKRILLKAMYSYISKMGSHNENFLTLYGTNSYEQIWEKMCAEVLDSSLDKKLDELFEECPNSLVNCTLKEYIDNPIIHLDGFYRNMDKLRPDLIITSENKNQFIILDAKYRNLNLNTKFLDLYDVNKQFLYQLAYSKLISSEKINEVNNVLLFPTYNNEVKNRGCITSKMFSGIGLEDIQLIELPASIINEYYLDDVKKPISWLKLKLNHKNIDKVNTD